MARQSSDRSFVGPKLLLKIAWEAYEEQEQASQVSEK